MPERCVRTRREHRKLTGLLIILSLLAAVFAKVEIQIEGAAGWAANLPTWRLDHHWLLDLIWGGRPLTGYHVWVFLFMMLVFHLIFFLHGRFSARLELRVLGSLALFWIQEDFFWFVLNPAFGFSRFKPQFIPWHHHWALGVPVDYIVFPAIGILMLWLSFRQRMSVARLAVARNSVWKKS